MNVVKALCAMLIVFSLAVLAGAPQVKAEFPDYQVLVNTSGVGLPDFPEAIAGRNVTLQAWRAGSVGGMGGIGVTHWSFGDGTTADASSEFVWHVYAQSGVYHVVVDVYASMGAFLWHYEQDITVYNLLSLPALDVSAVNGQTVEFVYDAPSLTGDPSAMFVDFSGPCDSNGSFLSWNGNNTPYDAPRVSMNGTLYVTAKGLGVTGAYNFYACSVGPGRTDPISPATPSAQIVISVTASAGGSANLHLNQVHLLMKSTAPAASNGDNVVRPVVAPKKGGIRLQ